MKETKHNLATEYDEMLKEATPGEVLSFFASRYPGKVAFSSSLGAEDQALTHMICNTAPGISIFTLDTGRLFQETYDLLHISEQKYGIRIRIFFPDAAKVEKMVNEKGVNLFYENIENRKICCNIRKIEPLERALEGTDIWITGLRREQSLTRTGIGKVAWDETYNVIKVSPLLDWSEAQVWDYIRANGIPYNELHDKGYPSIGCLPCTRAVAEGESLRSGRWWWELPENKECGLHHGNE